MGSLLTPRFLFALVPATAAVALATGLPTDVLPNPWFQRMTPVRALDIVLWPLLSLSVGALLASYALPGSSRTPGAAAPSGGLLGAFAIGCPVCNKLVVAVLGVTGALRWFEPIQPLLGAGAIVLALVALRRRLRALAGGCPIGAEPAPAAG